MRVPRSLVGAMAVAAAWAQPAPAQEVPAAHTTNAVVEQRVADDAYLNLLDTSAAAALAIGDSLTMRAVDAGAAVLRTRGVLLARGGARIVLRLAGEARLAVGDTVVLEAIPRAAAAGAVANADTPPAPMPLPPGPSPAVSGPARGRTARAAMPPSLAVTGRIGLSASAIHSAGRWAEAEDSWSRTDATPAARAYLRADHLPGDLRLTLNGRIDRRFALEDGGTSADAKARIYEAHLEKRFDAMPLHVRAGRFRNPYEPFSDPLDGALMRWDVGGGFGAGAAGGFRTRWSDAELTTELPVARAFVDYDWSGGSAFVHAVVSGGREWPDSGGTRTMVAAQQFLGWGIVRLSTELRAARAPAATWALSDVRLAGALRPVAPLRLSLRYSHAGDAWSWTGWQTADARRRIGTGIGWTGERVSAGADFSYSRTEPRDATRQPRTGRSATAWAQLEQTVLNVSPALSATWWQDDLERAVIQIAPSLLVPIGAGRMRAEYRWERADMKSSLAAPDLPVETQVTHGASASLSIPIRSFFLQLSGSHRSGGGVSTMRVYTGLEARLR